MIAGLIKARWLPALLILLLMQANKETALLMMLFLAPYGWRLMGRRMVPGAAGAFALCLVGFLWVRWAQFNLPGQPTEWHLPENLIFWSRLTSWTSREDFYSLGIALPRMTFLVFAVASLVFGWYKKTSPLLLPATFSFVILAVLLLFMGFEDEFRNLSLSLPLLTLIWAEPTRKKTVLVVPVNHWHESNRV